MKAISAISERAPISAAPETSRRSEQGPVLAKFIVRQQIWLRKPVIWWMSA
jgi:hypothetical protein